MPELIALTWEHMVLAETVLCHQIVSNPGSSIEDRFSGACSAGWGFVKLSWSFTWRKIDLSGKCLCTVWERSNLIRWVYWSSTGRSWPQTSSSWRYESIVAHCDSPGPYYRWERKSHLFLSAYEVVCFWSEDKCWSQSDVTFPLRRKCVSVRKKMMVLHSDSWRLMMIILCVCQRVRLFRYLNVTLWRKRWAFLIFYRACNGENFLLWLIEDDPHLFWVSAYAVVRHLTL